jgi:hypothetical protein
MLSPETVAKAVETARAEERLEKSILNEEPQGYGGG